MISQADTIDREMGVVISEDCACNVYSGIYKKYNLIYIMHTPPTPHMYV